MRSLPLLASLVLLLSPTLRADEDTRVGTVLDTQGTALVRPVGRDRWTPIGPKSVLMPGDLVRTPVRGANAVEIRLTGKGRLLVGPGSLVELPAAGSVRLLRGEIETTAVEKVALPSFLNAGPIDTSKTNVFRSDGKKTELLAKPPRWLVGYRDSTTDEWMGSLLANVDGREVPLSVGYHKVTVDIRDQIARTTVEESFVNATKNTLEGVFYFPLPAGASISSFAMWIGDEMVEADIVEKQRARAIYEDILRKRKDPGLLEWSGGNLFKARVFPIWGHSEKRIRIQYTQVLPLEGATVRYRYALRSELLRAHRARRARRSPAPRSRVAPRARTTGRSRRNSGGGSGPSCRAARAGTGGTPPAPRAPRDPSSRRCRQSGSRRAGRFPAGARVATRRTSRRAARAAA